MLLRGVLPRSVGERRGGVGAAVGPHGGEGGAVWTGRSALAPNPPREVNPRLSRFFIHRGQDHKRGEVWIRLDNVG